MFFTFLQIFVARNHHLGAQRLHPQKHMPYHLPKKKKWLLEKMKLDISMEILSSYNLYIWKCDSIS